MVADDSADGASAAGREVETHAVASEIGKGRLARMSGIGVSGAQRMLALAARLCGEASKNQILISPRIFSKTETQIDVEPVGELSLKGFNRPVPTYNVRAIRPEGSG
jgi:hypothetical protein